MTSNVYVELSQNRGRAVGTLHRHDDDVRAGSGAGILRRRTTGAFGVSGQVSQRLVGMQQRMHLTSSNQGAHVGR
jgi:hypothetical protein